MPANHPLIYAILGILLISFPQWAQSIWGLFSKEPLLPLIYSKVKAVKIPNFSINWITSSIGLLMLVYICIVSTPESIIQTTPATGMISEINTNYESQYESSKQNGADMLVMSRAAFAAGNYAYCVKFYEKYLAISPDKNAREYEPLYAAAILAQNPTADGYLKFHAQLNSMVGNFKTTWKVGAPRYGVAIACMGEIKKQLPPSEWKFIDDISDEIEKLMANSP